MLQPLDKAFWPRLAVTAAVLAAYRLGSLLPLPGLDPAALAQLAGPSGAALERASLLALGVMPLLNALMLIELVKLIAPGVRRWEAASARNRGRMGIIFVGLALLMALLQSTGYAAALEEVTNLVSEPGTQFRVVCISTLLAATALAIAFVTIIDRAGLGSGLWLLFLASGLAELPRTLAAIGAVNASGAYSGEYILLAAIFTVLAIAAVVSIMLAARAAPATFATCVWTPMFALPVATMALLSLGLITTFSIDSAVRFATPQTPWWYAAVAAAVLLVAWLYVRSYGLGGQPSPVPAAPIAASLAAILIASVLLQQQLGVLLPLNGTQIIVAAVVATTMLIEWGQVGGAAPVAEEELSPQA